METPLDPPSYKANKIESIKNCNSIKNSLLPNSYLLWQNAISSELTAISSTARSGPTVMFPSCLLHQLTQENQLNQWKQIIFPNPLPLKTVLLMLYQNNPLAAYNQPLVTVLSYYASICYVQLYCYMKYSVNSIPRIYCPVRAFVYTLHT